VAYLLDVSVLIALSWPNHDEHRSAQAWFRKNGTDGWATCPFTQAAFVRILMNQAFSREALSLKEATELLDIAMRHAAHEFWPADISLAQAIAPFRSRMHGHRQITDAYLLGLALHRKAKLATFDRALSSLLPEGSSQRASIIEIRREIR
jgi:toxin-antitoxin system PIN domain toxin